MTYLCACGQTPVDNQQNLWTTRDDDEQVSPPMPPLSRKDISSIAHAKIRDLERLTAALIEANEVLAVELSSLTEKLQARGLI